MQETPFKQEELAFLILTNFGAGRLMIIHNCSELGGNIGSNKDFFSAIQGIRKNSTCIISPDIEKLLTKKLGEQPVSKIFHILNSRSIQDIVLRLTLKSNSWHEISFQSHHLLWKRLIGQLVQHGEKEKLYFWK